MFANVDLANAEARGEILRWLSWLGRTLRLGGIRFDATKHISKAFQRELMAHVRGDEALRRWLVVGEYWHLDASFMAHLIDDQFAGEMALFDIPLVHAFRDFSEAPEHRADLRRILDSSLGRLRPDHSVVSSQSPGFLATKIALLIAHVSSLSS